VSQTVRILKRRKPKTIDEAIQILQQLIPPNFHRGQRRNTPKIPRVIPLPTRKNAIVEYVDQKGNGYMQAAKRD